jgi:hypothetical protein
MDIVQVFSSGRLEKVMLYYNTTSLIRGKEVSLVHKCHLY